jgi:thiamine biosynthesis lipoprotein
MWNAWRPVRASIVLALATLGALPGLDARAVRAILPHEFSQVHMGMPVRLRFHAPADAAAGAAQTAFARIAALDAMMSDYRADSELRRLGSTAGAWVVVSPDLFEVLSRAIEMSSATGGAFDPTIGPLVMLWRDARASRRLPDRRALEAARARVGWTRLHVDRSRRAVRLDRADMRLDLGGIAKGYILQHAVVALARVGVTRALVEAGGDIAVGDAPPGRDGWRIDVPGADAAFAARAAHLTNASLATSGPTAQFVEIDGVRYSHVVDPRTGRRLTNHVSAWVIASDGATADALATALTIVGAAEVPRIHARFPDTVVSVR